MSDLNIKDWLKEQLRHKLGSEVTCPFCGVPDNFENLDNECYWTRDVEGKPLCVKMSLSCVYCGGEITLEYTQPSSVALNKVPGQHAIEGAKRKYAEKVLKDKVNEIFEDGLVMLPMKDIWRYSPNLAKELQQHALKVLAEKGVEADVDTKRLKELLKGIVITGVDVDFGGEAANPNKPIVTTFKYDYDFLKGSSEENDD